MKRQLAPSPFTSPVLKHPCTVRDDDEDSQAPPNPCRKAPSPPRPHSPSSLTDESDDDDNLARPLCLADLCTQNSDLTRITSTACTSYFNAMCLEDSERDATGTYLSGSSRLHPLHSTAAHLGPTHLSNWQQTPVHFAASDSQDRNQTAGDGGSQIHIPASRSGFSHSTGLDSGVGGSSEFNNFNGLSPVTTTSNMHRVEAAAGGGREKFAVSSEQQESAAVNASMKVDGLVAQPATSSSNSWRNNQHTLSTIHEGVSSSPSPCLQAETQQPGPRLGGLGPVTSPPFLEGQVTKTRHTHTDMDSGLVLLSSDQSICTPVNKHQVKTTSMTMVSPVPGPTHHSTPSSGTSAAAFHATTPTSALVTVTTAKELITTGAPLNGHHTPDHDNWIPASKIPFSNGLLPTYVKMELQSHYLNTFPSIPLHATPTGHGHFLRATPTSLPGRGSTLYQKSPADGIGRASNSAHNTPHRYSGLKGVQVGGAVTNLNNVGMACPSSVFGDDLLKRKEMLKSRLHFKSEWVPK